VDGILSHAIEVTEQVHARRQLEESEERFRALADNIPNLAWMSDANGWIFWYNKRWYEYTGTTPEQMEGWGWQSVHDPNTLPAVMEAWKESIATGKPFNMVFPLKGADGTSRPFLTRVIPIRNQEGEIVKWFGTNTDVSEVENKNKELLKINADLDNFIYTASHDLKAPVANIEGLLHSMVETISEENKSNEEFSTILGLIEKSISRFKATILDLTEVSKAQKLPGEDIEEIPCAEIINNVQLTIPDQIKQANAEINIDVSECGSIKFSRKNLQSIVYNLISNAIKYRDPERPLKINVWTKKENNYIVLTVQDNGLGISETNKPKLFTMFKRFHDHVEGTGIGLYIVKRIIDNAGGKIEVESQLKEGSTFKIYFPN
jgi:PAS domain S-box-containing protein